MAFTLKLYPEQIAIKDSSLKKELVANNFSVSAAFPGYSKLATLAEMSKHVARTDAPEIKENLVACFWFVLTCAPWLVGALTLLVTLAHWFGWL